MRVLQRTNYFWYTFGYTRFFFAVHEQRHRGVANWLFWQCLRRQRLCLHFLRTLIRSPSTNDADYVCHVFSSGSIEYRYNFYVDYSCGRFSPYTNGTTWVYYIEQSGDVHCYGGSSIRYSYGKKLGIPYFRYT